jgi:hypothetical protein
MLIKFLTNFQSTGRLLGKNMEEEGLIHPLKRIFVDYELALFLEPVGDYAAVKIIFFEKTITASFLLRTISYVWWLSTKE